MKYSTTLLKQGSNTM